MVGAADLDLHMITLLYKLPLSNGSNVFYSVSISCLNLKDLTFQKTLRCQPYLADHHLGQGLLQMEADWWCTISNDIQHCTRQDHLPEIIVLLVVGNFTFFKQLVGMKKQKQTQWKEHQRTMPWWHTTCWSRWILSLKSRYKRSI